MTAAFKKHKCNMNHRSIFCCLIFLAQASVGTSNALGASSLPVCTPKSYECNTPASSNYIFIGAGNWNMPEN